jgi:hypothetical protein
MPDAKLQILENKSFFRFYDGFFTVCAVDDGDVASEFVRNVQKKRFVVFSLRLSVNKHWTNKDMIRAFVLHRMTGV